jgi:multidrug resistance efflux pump
MICASKLGAVALLVAVSGLEAAGAVSTTNLVAETNAVCRHLYIGVGQAVRAGDALVALEPPGATGRIAAARSEHAAREREFQAARTNRLALLQLREQAKVSEEEWAAAERDYERALGGREQALGDLNRIHREFRTRVLYAPRGGRVTGLPVPVGREVEPGEVVVTLEPSGDE